MSAKEYLTLQQAAELVPGRPNNVTLWRWCRYGVKGKNGQRIRLESRRVGARLFVKQPWLDEFFDEVTKVDAETFAERQEAARPKPRKTSSSVRRRQKESAKRVLREAKIIV